MAAEGTQAVTRNPNGQLKLADATDGMSRQVPPPPIFLLGCWSPEMPVDDAIVRNDAKTLALLPRMYGAIGRCAVDRILDAIRATKNRDKN